MRDLRRNRERMIREQILARGIQDSAVVAAMSKVPRHLFVDEALAAQAYADNPVPIGHRQTISQPYIVALMSQMLDVKRGMTVLEIGTGSGYQAAVLAEMGAQVCTVECIAELHVRTSQRLQDMGYTQIQCRLSDGTLGWPEKVFFDRILVTAGGPEVPDPLLDQLGDTGKLLIPVGVQQRSQKLVLVHQENGRRAQESRGNVAFVDLVGMHGW